MFLWRHIQSDFFAAKKCPIVLLEFLLNFCYTAEEVKWTREEHENSGCRTKKQNEHARPLAYAVVQH